MNSDNKPVMQNILLVEDDPEITRLIILHFDATQYQLTCCSTKKEALEKMASGSYDLIMLDISLPDGNGMEICKQFRAADADTPLMMVTCNGEEADKVLALELGADDYITKPFGIMELKARVKAIMRRSARKLDSGEQKKLAFGELVIDPLKRKASLRNDRLELTVKEFDILYLMARNPGKTFTRQALLEQVWGFAFAGYEHTITSHINRLRIKLEKDLNHPEYILTAWGSGYRFTE